MSNVDTDELARGKRRLLLPIVVAAAGLIAIAILEDAPTRHGIEANLTSRSVHALADAGVSGVRVSFAGRDATIYAPTSADGKRALVVVTNLNGVRTVTVVVAGQPGTVGPTPSGSPIPSASPTPAPSPSTPPSTTPSGSPTTSPVTVADVQKQINALSHVEFTTGSSTLTTASHAVIVKLAAILRANPTVRIRIEGNTDAQGSASDNLVLSRARADSVYHALQALGIVQSRMTTVGYGESRPKVPNTSDANRAINRRVDIIAMS